MESTNEKKIARIMGEDIANRAYFLVEEIIKGKLFIKMKQDQIILVDGRIIKFSDLIKLLCTKGKIWLKKANFDYKLTFESAEKKIFTKIIEFYEILEWETNSEMEQRKANELFNWFNSHQNLIKEIFNLAAFLRMEKIVNYIKNKSSQEKSVIRDDLLFKTEIGIINTKLNLQTCSSGRLERTNIDELKSKNFEDAQPPQYNEKNMCLEIPINLNLIKKNAVKNFSEKNKLNHILKDDELNKLTDAMISDSFWFTVSFFKTINIEKRESNVSKKPHHFKEEKTLSPALKEAVVILKRISENYFKFFIKLCDETSSARKDQKDLKDNILEIFYDFLSQCVFYSIFLAFPKSRYMFDDIFRFKIVAMFAYIYNGLIIQNFSLEHWDLDLGTGNIIENQNQTRKPKKNDDEKENLKDEFIYPDLIDVQNLIINNFKVSDRKKQDNVILNTPLYRFYTENNKFETLNMIKPIKLSKKDNYDVDAVEKKIELYSKKAKNAVKNSDRISEYYNQLNKEDENTYIAKRKFNMENNKRLYQEFKDIKAKRFQEYANYCIFISSK